jgi:tetratricopeptide (TPR) repeat protein
MSNILLFWIDTSKIRHLMIPLARNPHFVGRQEEIHKIEDLISVPDGLKKLAITGLGGVGKTQIALELAYRMRDREPECSIFWIPCTSYEAVEQACMAIAHMVGIQDVKPAGVKELLKAYFSQIDNEWLLIFDNADDTDMWMKNSSTASALREFLPYNTQGRIIFTTRNRKLAVKLASSDVIHVRELDKNSGVDFLGKYLIEETLLNDHHAVVTLLEQLTFLPLALIQAATYINENCIRISDYLLLLHEQEADVVELLSEDFGDDGRYKDIQNPVALTWLVSFHQIQKLDPLAADYLSLMACVDPRNIPESFLPRAEPKKRMIDALGILSAYSFITLQPGNESITLHRLVHLATRNWMRKDRTFSAAILKTAEQLQMVFPDDHHSKREVWRKYMPHALALMGEKHFQAERQRYQGLLWNVGKCLVSDARYIDAKNVIRGVMELRQRSYGRTDISTLSCMSWLAVIYCQQGKWKVAETMFAELIETQKQVLGPKHLDTLNNMHNLATVYWNQKEWEKAEKLELQVIEVLKQIPGRESRSQILAARNCLGSIYESQRKLRQAEGLKMQVVQLCKEELGPEHPNTLTSMANLASTYSKQERWKEAQELAMQVMETRKQMLGPKHPDTLTSMANLASTYRKQGRWTEAQELEMEVMESRKQVLGPKRPHTLTSMHSLAYAYNSLEIIKAP